MEPSLLGAGLSLGASALGSKLFGGKKPKRPDFNSMFQTGMGRIGEGYKRASQGLQNRFMGEGGVLSGMNRQAANNAAIRGQGFAPVGENNFQANRDSVAQSIGEGQTQLASQEAGDVSALGRQIMGSETGYDIGRANALEEDGAATRGGMWRLGGDLATRFLFPGAK